MRERTRLALLILVASVLLACKIYYIWEICQLNKSANSTRNHHFIDRTQQDWPPRRDLMEGAHAEQVTAVSKKPANISADANDLFLEGPLPVAFKNALEKYPIVPTTDVKIVLIVAYYRSGSSFFGELMSSTPRTFFHYEPLMLFTVAGGIRPGRQHHAFQLLDALAGCHFEPLYTAWMESTPYYKKNHFLADICEGGESCFSPGYLSGLCSRAQAQVFKFTRLRVTQVQSWIQKNPEMAPSVRVVHLVRDPRAMYASRRRLDWCKNDAHCGSAAALCSQMRSDLDAFAELGHHLPSNRTYQIRFEDLAADPLNETRQLFTRLGLEFSPSVSEYVGNHTTATGGKTKDAFSTWRNTKEVADRWRYRLPRGTIRTIQTTCNDVLLRLGYKLV